jgi:hypothetical protein
MSALDSPPLPSRYARLFEGAEALFSIPTSHHAGKPARRRKTVVELIEGHETIELFDRLHPGKLMRRRDR